MSPFPYPPTREEWCGRGGEYDLRDARVAEPPGVMAVANRNQKLWISPLIAFRCRRTIDAMTELSDRRKSRVKITFGGSQASIVTYGVAEFLRVHPYFRAIVAAASVLCALVWALA